MNKNNLALLVLLTVTTSHIVLANNVHSVSSPKIDDVTIFKFSESNPTGDQVYLSKDMKSSLNPSNMGDIKKLADSVEFEVYEMKEGLQAHTVFEAGGGICTGFDTNGVNIIDSRTYYVDQANNQYYASISGATVYAQQPPANVQYAPLFNIENPALAKGLQEQEREYGRKLASKNIKKSSNVLSNIVCKP